MKKPEEYRLKDHNMTKTTHQYSSSDPALFEKRRGSREVGSRLHSNNNNAVDILKSGGIVIFPTDTVYGIGCRFDDQKAIARLYQIKGTPQNQPFPILVSNINQVKKLATITKIGQILIDKYWPGALTIILPTFVKGQKIGFRMPKSDLVKSLIDQIGIPIIGTSANFRGQKAVKNYQELDPKIIKLADLVIKGECKKGIESTVVDATFDPPKILRQGAVTLII